MSTDPLATLALDELRALAAGRGIPGSARLGKGELIAALAQVMVTTPRREPPHSGKAISSSSQVRTAPVWHPPAPEHGLPIPEHYGRDHLVLMVQDPSHIFAYWEVIPATIERARTAAGNRGAPVLVLHHAGGSEQREVDLRSGNYYLAVAANGDYTAELAWRDEHGRLHRIALSNRVRTPAAGPSWRTDEAWMHVEEHFLELGSLFSSPGSSSTRFRNERLLQLHPIEVDDEHEDAKNNVSWVPGVSPSSLALAPSSGTLARRALSSGILYSSGVLSSRALSSRALSSSSLANSGPAEVAFPIAGVFHAPATGLPKSAEGVSEGPPPRTTSAPFVPATATVHTPATTRDPLGFLGAPKPVAQRKSRPKR